MALNDSKWRDLAWMKAQARERRAFWVSAVVWLVTGFLPMVPVTMNKGAGHRYDLGRFPVFILYGVPSGSWPWLIAHVGLSAVVGLVLWRAIRGSARLIRRVNLHQ